MLYIGANHLGNFSDTPSKVISLIKTVDYVVVEFESLFFLQLQALNLEVPKYIVYENNLEFIKKIIDMLKNGHNILLLSEMGCVGVADQGSLLVSQAIKEKISIETIVGPSIPGLAVASCGYRGDGFISFETFDRTDKIVIQKLEELKNLNYIITILDYKERVIDIAKMSDKIFKNRGLCLCINIGWPNHQKIIRGSISEIIEILENNTIENIYGITEFPPMVTMVFSPFNDN